jgi:hypothetical protein
MFPAGAAYADLDNDGDLDLVVNNANDYAGIYKNNNELLVKNNFLKIKLLGEEKNQWGIGSKVTVYSNGNKYYQEEMPVRGFESSVDPVLNFGIGKKSSVDSVVIIWPNDRMQTLKNVKANQTISVNIKDASTTWVYDSTTAASNYFIQQPAFNFTHTENQFNDFTIQPLLINYLSRQGPCMAKADVNGDGREDIFIGGAKGQPGRLFLQLGQWKIYSKFSIRIDERFFIRRHSG